MHDEAELERAQEQGADFVFASPVHPVEKPGRKTLRPLGIHGLRQLVQRSRVPVFALGGITPGRVAPLMDVGAHGVAVLSGIGSADDPAAATRTYLEAIDQA